MRPQNVWLGDAAGRPIIHLAGPLPGKAANPAGAASRLDHVAMDCEGLDDWIGRLDAEAIPFERVRIEVRGMTQLNIHEPNGMKVELTFAD